jgi:hypothetical protein
MTEFDDVIRRLRESRPTASELELDEIKQRVRRRAARPAGRNGFMRSRIGVVAMLVLGMVFSTAGAGLAVDGLTGSQDAAEIQYGPDTPGGEGNGGGEGVLPGESAGGGGGADDDVQAARQVEAGSDTGELPFTGFLAIPVLLGGIALLTTGLIMRRRT